MEEFVEPTGVRRSMPPKNSGPSKKTEAKAKAKVIEDKTFGLKNKNKSTKVTKFIESVEKQVNSSGNQKRARDEADAKAALRDKKRVEEERKAELAALFKPVVPLQKVPPGVDPKTVLCAYFKAGQCAKGDKCKFSHDVNVERRAAKINVYEDRRMDGGDEEGGSAYSESTRAAETMTDWDQAKLEAVVQRRHGKNAPTTTDIVCKYFLDAIERKGYGWFWECPNGGDACKYRHALPPGFVLRDPASGAKAGAKRSGVYEDADGEEISLEEFLEVERYRIEKRTPVTAESFARWKADRVARIEAETRARESEKEAQIRAGRMLHASGRDLFTYNPEMFMAGDDDEAMDVDYNQREADEHAAHVEDASAFLDEDLENLEIESSGAEGDSGCDSDGKEYA